MTKTLSPIEEAVARARQREYLEALTLFVDVYGSGESVPLNTAKAATGLSYFGLCLALVQRKYKVAIELCKRAIELEFYSGDHYANLARVYIAAGNRKKALETIDSGFKIAHDHPYLTAVRQELGVRARPAVPFLDRSHPINVTLGQARHAKKLAEKETTKKTR